MTREVCAGWRSFLRSRHVSRTSAPSPLSTILVNLCQYDVLASTRSDSVLLHEAGTRALTSHSAGFLQVGAVSEREYGRIGILRTKHPFLYPLPDLLYPELDLIAIFAWRPHARLQCGGKEFLHVRLEHIRIELLPRRGNVGSWGCRGTHGGHHETEVATLEAMLADQVSTWDHDHPVGPAYRGQHRRVACRPPSCPP